MQIGDVIKAKIMLIKDYGILMDIVPEANDNINKGVKGFAITAQAAGVDINVGNELFGRILDINVVRNIVDLSLRPEFVNKKLEQKKQNKEKKKKKKKKKKQKIKEEEKKN